MLSVHFFLLIFSLNYVVSTKPPVWFQWGEYEAGEVAAPWGFHSGKWETQTINAQLVVSMSWAPKGVSRIGFIEFLFFSFLFFYIVVPWNLILALFIPVLGPKSWASSTIFPVLVTRRISKVFEEYCSKIEQGRFAVGPGNQKHHGALASWEEGRQPGSS